MKQFKTVSLLSLFVVVIGLSFVISPVYAEQKPIELTYSNFFPAPHKNAILSVEWGKEVEKRTNGRVKVTVFPGGTLTPAAQCYDGVVKGLSDVGLSVLGYTRGRFPLTEVIDLPLGYRNALEATKLINIYYKKFKPKEFDDVKVMYLHAHGPGILHTKKPVEKLEDIKGMKISCHGLSAKVVSALGAVPVAMPMPERYDAIQKGVAEGGMFPEESLKGWKLAEVVNYTTQDFGAAYTTGFFVVMNKDKWNSLDPKDQNIIEEINLEWAAKHGEAWDTSDMEGVRFFLEQGNTIFGLDAKESAKWENAVAPVIDRYAAELDKKGLNGKAVIGSIRESLKKLH